MSPPFPTPCTIATVHSPQEADFRPWSCWAMLRRLADGQCWRIVQSGVLEVASLPAHSSGLVIRFGETEHLLFYRGSERCHWRHPYSTAAEALGALESIQNNIEADNFQKQGEVENDEAHLLEEETLLLPENYSEFDHHLTAEDPDVSQKPAGQSGINTNVLQSNDSQQGEASAAHELLADVVMPSQYRPPPQKKVPVNRPYLLMQEKDWEGIREALQGHESDPVWLETAWNQLKVIENVPEFFLKVMADHTIKAVDSLMPRNFAGIMHCCARMDYLDLDLLEVLAAHAQRITDERAYSPRQLSTMLYAYGVMHRKATFMKKIKKASVLVPSQNSLVKFCTDQLMARQNELNQHDIAMMIYSLGLLEYDGDERFYRSLMEELQRPWHLDKFSQQDLVTIAYGLVKSKQVDLRKSCLTLFREILRPERIDQFNLQNMGMFLRCLINPAVSSMAREEINFLPLLEKLTSKKTLQFMGPLTLRTITLALGIFRVRDQEMWERLIDYIMEEKWFSQVRPFDISIVLYSMGIAQYYRADALMSMCEHLMNSAPLTFGPNGVSNVTFGLAQLRYKHQGLVGELVSHALEPGFLEKCTDLQLSNLAFSMGQIRARSETLPLSEALGKFLIDSGQAQSLTTNLYVNTAFGLTTAGLNEPTVLQPLMEELLNEERVQSMTTSHISMAMFCLGSYGGPISTSLEPMICRLKEPHCLESFDIKDVARIIRALARLKVNDKLLAEKVISLLGRGHLKLSTIRCHALVDLLEAHSILDLYAKGVSRNLVREAVREERVSLYNSFDLSRASSALAKVCVRKGLHGTVEVLLDELIAKSRLNELQCEAICSVASCLAHFGQCDRRTANVFAEEATHAERLLRYTPWQLCSLFYDLCILNLPSRLMLKKVSTELRKPGVVVQLRPVDLVSIFKGMYACRWHDMSLIEAALNHFLKEKRISELSSNHLANVVYGMTLVRGWDGPWMEKILSEMLKPDRLANLSNWDIAITIYSAGRVGYSSEQHVVPLAKELVSRDRLQTMSCMDLVNAVHGLSAINFDESSVLDPLIAEVLSPSRIESHSFEELVRLVNCCSGWRYIDRSQLLAVAERVTDPEAVELLRPVQKLTVFQALIKMQYPEKEIVDGIMKTVAHPDNLKQFHAKDLQKLKFLLDVYPSAPEDIKHAVDFEMKDRKLMTIKSFS